MGLFDTLLGRTKPVRANLDALFALPSAAVTLQISCGLVSTRNAGVCFKPPSGQSFTDMQTELEKLLELGDTTDTGGAPTTSAASPAGSAVEPPAPGGSGPPPPDTLTVRHVGDRFGYRWILVEGGDLDDLVTRVHMVHSSLEDAGWSAQLLCSVFGFAPEGPGDAATGGETPSAGDGTASGAGGGSDHVHQGVYLVYLAKQGTFYPFAPTGSEQRDTELELRLRSVLGTDLPVESDLSRWFPIWDLPVA